MKISRLKQFTLSISAFCVLVVGTLLYLSSIFPIKEGDFPLDRKWSRRLGERITDISVSEKSIVLANTMDSIIALKIDDGHILWNEHFNVQLMPFPVSIENDVVYFLDKNSLSAVELETGKLLWRQALLNSHARILDVSDNYLIVNFLSTSINVYDTKTGTALWSLPARRGYVQAFIDQNKVYVLGDEIEEVNAETGKVIWMEQLDTKGKGFYADGVMFFAGGDPFNMTETYVVAFNVIDRRELWRTKLITKEVNEFLLNRETLFLLDQGSIYALNKLRGDLNWKTNIASPTNPVIVEDRIFVLEGFARAIRALDINSGRVIGSLRTSWPHPFLSDSQTMASYTNLLLFSQDSKIFVYGTELSEP